MEYDIIKKKYPISRHGRQCMGPCYKPNTWMIHPVTLEYHTNDDFPFCPTEIWIDPKDQLAYNIDECIKPSDKIDNTIVEMNMILPIIHFTGERFLKIYYKIYSFENAISWINKNKHSSIYTKLRILNCAWKAYGNTVDVINDYTVNVYINIIKQHWIKKIFKHIEKYIHISGKNIYFKKPSSKATKINNKNIIEKFNFIIIKLITKNNIYKFLTRYVEEHEDRWDKIENHNVLMQSYLIKYLVNKIEETVY